MIVFPICQIGMAADPTYNMLTNWTSDCVRIVSHHSGIRFQLSSETLGLDGKKKILRQKVKANVIVSHIEPFPGSVQ